MRDVRMPVSKTKDENQVRRRRDSQIRFNEEDEDDAQEYDEWVL